VYFADNQNNVVREIDTTGVITTIAGNGSQCAAPPNCGDGSAATSAQLSMPLGVAIDSNGAIYIADWGASEIRRIQGGIISRYAGTGTAGTTGAQAIAIEEQQSVHRRHE
jgi:hypothetical protein